MNKLLPLIGLLTALVFPGKNYFGQINLEIKNQILDTVISELQKKHDFQISYEGLLGKCELNFVQQFKSLESALKALAIKCECELNKSGDIYIFSRRLTPQITQLKFEDDNTGERLAYTTILIDEKLYLAGNEGELHLAAARGQHRLKARHIGYNVLDTVLSFPLAATLQLSRKETLLKEFIVNDSSLSIPVFDNEINTAVTSSVPGNASSYLNNYLRLSAGIMAAGEQHNDFVTWGSYKGQTHLIYDGITWFNLSDLKEDYGSINGLTIDNIQYYKGGYQVDIGDRIGGVVKVSGKDHIPHHHEGTFHINNQMIGLFSNTPIGNKSALILGGRWAYPENGNKFYDGNFKLVKQKKNGDSWRLTGIYARNNIFDRFDENKDGYKIIAGSVKENYQQGASFNYYKPWKSGGISELTFASSSLHNDHRNFQKIKPLAWGPFKLDYANHTLNGFGETSVKTNHTFVSRNNHNWQVGAGVIKNGAIFSQDTTKTILKKNFEKQVRIHTYLKDEIRITRKWHLIPGLKIELPLIDKKMVIQPRIQSKCFFGEYEIGVNIGKYAQFVSENALIDQFGNSQFYWNLGQNSFVSARHYVLSLNRNYKKGFLKIESYHKNGSGLERFLEKNGTLNLYSGSFKTFGIDFSLQYENRGQGFLVNYSLSSTTEHFDYFLSDQFQRALQDQRHELKLAYFYEQRNWRFSGTYIWGSGIPLTNSEGKTFTYPYNRADLSLQYKLPIKKTKTDIGFSVLNVFNTKNIRYNNFAYFPEYDFLFDQGIPITFQLFLTCSW